MTLEAALAMEKTHWWETASAREIAMFQMFEGRLVCPFDVFQQAVEDTLKRPVWTHEFGMNVEGLKKELLGTGPAPTFEDIMNLIPTEKRILYCVEETDEDRLVPE